MANLKISVSEDPNLDTHLLSYVGSLRSAHLESDAVRRFKQTWPVMFSDLLTFHLSLLIDCPVKLVLDTDSTTKTSSARDSQASVVANNSGNSRLAFHNLRSLTTRSNVMGLKKTGQSGGAKRVDLSPQVFFNNIHTLLETLDNEEFLSTEGIFRKTGNVARQRALLGELQSDDQLDPSKLMTRVVSCDNVSFRRPNSRPTGSNKLPSIVESHHPSLSIHDLACVLKTMLHGMPEPLLTSRLLPYFVQVADLTYGRMDDKGRRVTLRPIEASINSAKQLNALRLLCRLLPLEHAHTLQRLLNLLGRVVSYESVNLMSADSLGTLFGPILFMPNKLSKPDRPSTYVQLGKLASIMIVQGPEELWKLPSSLYADILHNMQQLETQLEPDLLTSSISQKLTRCSSRDSGISGLAPTNTDRSSDTDSLGSSSVASKESDIKTARTGDNDLPALVTCVAYNERNQSSNLSSDDQSSTSNPSIDQGGSDQTTMYAVAELYATIYSLPPRDPRRKRLLPRFNAANGGLQMTPNNHAVGTPVSNAITSSIKTTSKTCLSDITRSTPSLPPNPGLAAFSAATGGIRSSVRRRLLNPIQRGQMKQVKEITENPVVDQTKPIADIDSPKSDSSKLSPETPIRRIEPPTTFHLSSCDEISPQNFQPTKSSTKTPSPSESICSRTDVGPFSCCACIPSPFRSKAKATPNSRNKDIQSTNYSAIIDEMAEKLFPPECGQEIVEETALHQVPVSHLIEPSFNPCSPNENTNPNGDQLLRPSTQPFQQKLSHYGYRKISHTNRRRSSKLRQATAPYHIHPASLRRSKTLPSSCHQRRPSVVIGGLRPGAQSRNSIQFIDTSSLMEID